MESGEPPAGIRLSWRPRRGRCWRVWGATMSCSGRCWLPARGRSVPPPLLLCPPPPRPPPPSSSSSAAAEPCAGHRRQQRRRGRSLTRGAPCPCRGGGRGRSPRRSRSSTVSPCWGRHQRAGWGAVTAGGGRRLGCPPPAPSGRPAPGGGGGGATGRTRRLAPPPAPLLPQGAGQRQVRPAWPPAALPSAAGTVPVTGSPAGRSTHTHTRGELAVPSPAGASRGPPGQQSRARPPLADGERPCLGTPGGGPRVRAPPESRQVKERSGPAGRAGPGGGAAVPSCALLLRRRRSVLRHCGSSKRPDARPRRLGRLPAAWLGRGSAGQWGKGPRAPLGSSPGSATSDPSGWLRVCVLREPGCTRRHRDISESRTRRMKISDIFGSQVIQENPVYLSHSLKVSGFFTRGLTKL